MQKTSVLRFHTSGNRDPFRQGYQYRQRVAGPIEPMEGRSLRDGLLAYGLNLAARVFAKQQN